MFRAFCNQTNTTSIRRKMKPFITPIFLFLATVSAVGQSARVKPSPTPTPNPNLRPSIIYIPAAKTDASRPRTAPSPTPVSSPTESDVIRVESTLVPIPVSVIDGQGRAVTNLRLDDFDLKIDGQAVQISQVSRSESPIRLAMLFDNSSSVLMAREFEKDAAVKFFRRVVRPDRDLAALFSVADRTQLEQPLTKDVSLLVRAIQNFPPPEGATALLDGIIKVADYLNVVDGRRVIVIVSDGEDTISDLETTLEKVIKRLQMANCQVYVVKTKDYENYKRTGIRQGNANIRVLDAERRMLEIAGQTGGSVYSPVDDSELSDAFARISAELSDQYILSYYPDSDADKGGEFRNITVSVRGKQNATVRTRKGYYVPKRN
jgi:Ca-activated chloride channel family protein